MTTTDDDGRRRTTTDDDDDDGQGPFGNHKNHVFKPIPMKSQGRVPPWQEPKTQLGRTTTTDDDGRRLTTTVKASLTSLI